MNNQQIRHTVAFSLKHETNAPETEKFLKDAYILLTSISVVQNFEVLRQVSPKNDLEFGFSMEFENQSAFEEYCNHPTHVKFVKERWDTEVESFAETDYQNVE